MPGRAPRKIAAKKWPETRAEARVSGHFFAAVFRGALRAPRPAVARPGPTVILIILVIILCSFQA